MEVLIVGGGMAGMSLAALLESRHVEYTVVERADNFEDAGYMLGLYPLGSRILHGLGLWERFLEVSEPMQTYEVSKSNGQVMQSYDLSGMNERLGPMRQLSRGELLRLLCEAVPDERVRMGTTIAAIEQRDECVEVTFDDGRAHTYDLVVGADGIHSTVRETVFGEASEFDTGWGAWVWWADSSAAPHGKVSEFWGAGEFLGVYPTRDRLGMVAVYPRNGGDRPDNAEIIDEIRSDLSRLGKDTDISVDDAMPRDDQDLFYWPLADTRASQWVRGRVVLMGDAAAAFLPTAGVGASMAMESAAVLADELSRTDAHLLDQSLALYVERRKQRVQAIQAESRRLSRMMFVESRPMAALRDFAMRFYTLDRLIHTIAKSLNEPI